MNLTTSGPRQKPSLVNLIPRQEVDCFFCRSGATVCASCFAGFTEVVLRHNWLVSSGLPATALFSYVPPLRDLILEVKIRGNLKARRVMAELVARYAPRPLHVDVVIPAPSSLWSRLRGRFDLAWMLARQIATTADAVLIEAPFLSHWRLQKQAMLRKRKQDTEVGIKKRSACDKLLPSQLNDLFVPRLAGKKILLVDDVITSGATLRRLAAFFPHHRCSAFAFCLSPNHRLQRGRQP